MSNFRTWLVLGRVSNLTTVWGNGLCAWILGGGERPEILAGLLAGLSLIYMGGMFQNDFCDVEFDEEHHPERPIPSGRIKRVTVLIVSGILFVAGLLVLVAIDFRTLRWALILLGLIFLYNLIHKRTALSVALMAGCRTTIYPIVAVTTVNGINPLIWSAGVMMFYYVLGVTMLARIDSSKIKTMAVATAFLMLPMIGSLYLAGPPFGIYFPLSFCLPALWMAWTFSQARKSGQLILGKTIGPLLAGICLIDLAIVNSMHLISYPVVALFLVFFLIALLAQRYIPAS